jgi:hypothetical protein
MRTVSHRHRHGGVLRELEDQAEGVPIILAAKVGQEEVLVSTDRGQDGGR